VICDSGYHSLGDRLFRRGSLRGSDGTSTIPSITGTQSAQSSSAPTNAATNTQVSTPSDSLAKLIDVQMSNAGDHDHVVFTFDKSVATPHVATPSDSPAYCASGAPVQVTGQYLLEVQFSSAVAHNEDGTSSIPETLATAELAVSDRSGPDLRPRWDGQLAAADGEACSHPTIDRDGGVAHRRPESPIAAGSASATLFSRWR
jgi:hypothetical protein